MLQTITIESINVKAAKSGTGKNGKPYTLWPIGIKSNGEWLNGAAFNDKDVQLFQNLNNGDKIELEVWEEEWQGKPQKKFKLPTKEDRQKNDLEQVKKDVRILQETIKQLVKVNGLKFSKGERVYTAEPDLSKQKPAATNDLDKWLDNPADDTPF